LPEKNRMTVYAARCYDQEWALAGRPKMKFSLAEREGAVKVLVWQVAGKLGLPAMAEVGWWVIISQTAQGIGRDRAADSLRKGAGLARAVDRRLGREAAWAPG